MGKQSQRAVHDGGRATDSTEGDELYAQRRYDEAAEAYRRDAEDGQTGPGHGKLGNALFFAEDWEGAAEAFARAESLSPEHELASYWKHTAEICRENLLTRAELEVSDQEYARPTSENCAFPRPPPSGLDQVRAEPFHAPTLVAVVGRWFGRVAGAILSFFLMGIVKLIPAGLVYGDAAGRKWTRWYTERIAKKALRFARLKSVSDLMSVLQLARMREDLNAKALYDSYAGSNGSRQLMPADAKPPATAGLWRQADGSWTDPDEPTAGASFTLFGRNVEPGVAVLDDSETVAADMAAISPAKVSRLLLRQLDGEPQQEIPFLNNIAGFWIQFQNHDWVTAGDPSEDRLIEVPLDEGDPRRRQLGVDSIFVPDRADSPHADLAKAGIVARTNTETSWWDGSQIYGSTAKRQTEIRSAGHNGPGTGAYVHLVKDVEFDKAGMLPIDPRTGIEISGFVNRTWTAGLSFLHTLFAKEHNSIVDMLKTEYPQHRDDEEFLFQTARLINAAVMARIHTVEWTPAVLPNHVLDNAMNANWYGLLTNLFKKGKHRQALSDLAGMKINSPEFGGLIGNATDNHGVPYTLTQEFMAVYRLHSLIRDRFQLKSIDGDESFTASLRSFRLKNSHKLLKQVGLDNFFYSMGTSHPGQLILNNYPRTLQELSVPGFPVLDIAMMDILRDRQDSVPRYNELRRQLPGLVPLASLEELAGLDEEAAAGLSPDERAAREAYLARLKEVYGDGPDAIDKVDLLIGTLAENTPTLGRGPLGFGFGETLFHIFILNASRRLQADPFYTERYDAAHYTQKGLDWIDDVTLKDVLLRHHASLARTGLANVDNAFEPWDTDPKQLMDKTRHPLAHRGFIPGDLGAQS